MRSLEYLIQLFPNKTGNELLEIQKQDKLEDERERLEATKHLREFINEINSNGGYFKGSFSTSQYYYYKFTNLKLEGNRVYGDVEEIVFIHTIGLKDNHRIGSDDLSISIQNKTDQNLENYGLLYEDSRLLKRIDSGEYNEVKGELCKMVPRYFPEELKRTLKEFGE